MNDKIIFKVSVGQRFLPFVLLLGSFGMLIYLFYRTESGIVILVAWILLILFFFIAGIISLVNSFTTITADEDSIVSVKPLGSVSQLYFSQVGTIQHFASIGKLRLRGRDENVTIGIPEEHEVFPIFFDLLRAKRPDLWPIPTQPRFRIKSSLLAIIFSPFAMGLGPILFRQDPITLMLVVTLIYLFISYWRRLVIGLEINSDRLRLLLPFHKSELPFSQIQLVKLKLPSAASRHYSIKIEFGPKKHYTIYGFETNEVLIWDKLSSILPDRTVRSDRAT